MQDLIDFSKWPFPLQVAGFFGAAFVGAMLYLFTRNKSEGKDNAEKEDKDELARQLDSFKLREEIRQLFEAFRLSVETRLTSFEKRQEDRVREIVEIEVTRQTGRRPK